MRFNLRAQHLVVRSGERVTQYQLPKKEHIALILVGVVFLYLLVNPIVRNLFLQAARGLDGSKAVTAAQLAIEYVTTDAKNAAMVSRPPRESKLQTIRMTVPNNTLLKMQRSLVNGDPALGHDLGGNKPYFKALLESVDVAREIKVCLRGTMHWHHRPEKPSFRIKIKKRDVTRGDQYIELTTPEDALVIKNWLPMQLAHELGLMTDDSHAVRLFVNAKYFGVYIRSTRQGEPFALLNHRMPGTFFKAEFSPEMWQKATAWKMFGQEEPADQAVLQNWLDLLALPPTAENVERFEEIFDTETFASWAAVMAVAASIHTDDTHNHSYFFCSNQGKLEPLPWDCNGYGVHTDPISPVDVEVQPVLRFLNADPRWVHRRNQWIHHLINNAGSLADAVRISDAFWETMYPDLLADQNLGNISKFSGTGWAWTPTSVADLGLKRTELVEWIEERNQFLKDYLDNARFAIDSQSDGCRVLVFGSAAVEVRNTVTGQNRILYPGLSDTQLTHSSHQQQGVSQYQFVQPTMMAYRLDALPSQLQFFNAITGESVSESALPCPENEFVAARTIVPGQFSVEAVGDVVLGPGEVTLTNDLIVGRRQRLIVRAGTQLKLSAGVGIYSRGMTRFEGTASLPITVRGSDSEPWSAIGIAGEDTAGSSFEFVDVEGGSIGKLNQIRFKGMLNAYDCPDITLRNCTIGKNYFGDDAVNLAESTIHVDQCNWRDAKADALDLDMCTGVVTRCRWFNSGNDGLDLMSCTVNLNDCRIEGSGDKGISVGENSRLKAIGVDIVDCQIGTEVKDDSVAHYVDCVFQQCETAVHSYQKKWFYSGGGQTALVNCEVVGSRVRDVEMKAKSSVILVGTEIDSSNRPVGSLKQQKRVRFLDTLPTDWHDIMQPKEYQAH